MCSTSTWSPCARLSMEDGRSRQAPAVLISPRAQVTVAPGKTETRLPIVPGLTMQGIPPNNLHLLDIVEKQSRAVGSAREAACRMPSFHPSFLEEAYESCRRLCSEYAKTFYLGTDRRLSNALAALSGP